MRVLRDIMHEAKTQVTGGLESKEKFELASFAPGRAVCEVCRVLSNEFRYNLFLKISICVKCQEVEDRAMAGTSEFQKFRKQQLEQAERLGSYRQTLREMSLATKGSQKKKRGKLKDVYECSWCEGDCTMDFKRWFLHPIAKERHICPRCKEAFDVLLEQSDGKKSIWWSPENLLALFSREALYDLEEAFYGQHEDALDEAMREIILLANRNTKAKKQKIEKQFESVQHFLLVPCCLTCSDIWT